jgi:hypothetical protein
MLSIIRQRLNWDAALDWRKIGRKCALGNQLKYSAFQQNMSLTAGVFTFSSGTALFTELFSSIVLL